ncbi:MAG TPA: MXAN_5187 C-terminal domain-containing protein [Thermodesulfobacteriota bacterium]|nr:MXAN_5187 C-terminal domain-containing protein [Thermodesulfobacteriota bacterium]
MAPADDITALEKKLIQLKTGYEQYFLGMQKIAPEKLRSEVEKLIRLYTNQMTTNTALNFRLNTVVAKFSSYRTYWDRTMREIEEGRYIREKFRMKFHDRMSQPAPPVQLTVRPAAASPSEEESIKRVYEEYVKARKSTNEPIPKFEAVAELIKKQAPVIKEKYKASSVDFKVVIEDGKAKLKAVPKK